MATKTMKKKVITNVTLEQAQKAAQAHTTATLALEKVKVKMNEELNKVKGRYLQEIAELQESLKEPEETLEAFAYEQKDTWGKKSFHLLHAIIGFRTSPPKVDKNTKKFTWEGIVDVLENNNLFRFIRTVKEVNKEAILEIKDEAVLNQLAECNIEIVQDESFYITAKEEQVAA